MNSAKLASMQRVNESLGWMIFNEYVQLVDQIYLYYQLLVNE